MHGLIAAALAVSLSAWAYLLLLHGRFWRADQRLDAAASEHPGDAPAICAIVPARDEAEVIGRALRSLLTQDYRGALRVIVVDDQSTDGSAAVARRAAEEAGAADRLDIVAGAPLAEGWAGKVWALSQGVARAREIAPDARYLWFTDADVAHGPGVLRSLAAKAETGDLVLVSLMVRLHCESAWEKLLIPAFVYFFQKLYPFPLVNDRARRTAAAAGGCMLLRRDALEAAGSVQIVNDALIDDCALARALKRIGPIWLGLTDASRSIRPYRGLGDIWDMVARSAYAQLRYSPLLLAGSVAGMGLLYLVPPVVGIAALFGDPALVETRVTYTLGLGIWFASSVSYWPTLRVYGRSRLTSLLLPLAAFVYTLMTLDSALRHWRGQGARWKGRSYTPASRPAGRDDGH